MRKRLPPPSYNPPPMFGLRRREDWRRRVGYYMFYGNTLYACGGNLRRREVIGTYDRGLHPGDVLTLDANGASVNGRLVIPIPGAPYVDYSVGFDHFSYPAPLPSGSDAEP